MFKLLNYNKINVFICFLLPDVKNFELDLNLRGKPENIFPIKLLKYFPLKDTILSVTN